MKHLHLIRKNITRKKTRMLLTIGSYGAALFLFGLLVTFHDSIFGGLDAGSDRLVVRNKRPMSLLPYSYKATISQIPGVKAITSGSWFGGYYRNERNFFPQIVYDPEFIHVYPEIAVNKEQWDDYLKDRSGCIVGRKLANRFGWKLGDRIPIHGALYPGMWEFNIRGIYDNTERKDDTGGMFFHYKYLDERRYFKGVAGWYSLKIDNTENAERISRAIDERFMNSPFETTTQTEQAWIASFIEQLGNMKLFIITIGSVVFFSLLLVTGSSMSMAIRERTAEMGVMKTLGFSDLRVLFIVLAESVMYALVGGALGLFFVKLYTLNGDPTDGLLRTFYFSPLNIVFGLVVTMIFGVASGIIPAVNAMRLKIVDTLRRV